MIHEDPHPCQGVGLVGQCPPDELDEAELESELEQQGPTGERLARKGPAVVGQSNLPPVGATSALTTLTDRGNTVRCE